MRFLAPLLGNVLAVVALGALLTGYLLDEVLTPDGGLARALAQTIAIAVAAQVALVVALLARAARPLRLAAARGWQVPEDEAARAAEAAHWLPATAAGLVGGTSVAAAAAVLAVLRAQGQ